MSVLFGVVREEVGAKETESSGSRDSALGGRTDGRKVPSKVKAHLMYLAIVNELMKREDSAERS